MRHRVGWLAAGLVAAFLASQGIGRDEGSTVPTCGAYGTSVEFEASPTAAAKRALKDEKLVFVLHISGHFENSDFT